MTHRITVDDRVSPCLPRRAPQPTGGHSRAVFELLRFLLGVGAREVPFHARQQRFAVDMVFRLPGGILAVEYDSAYYHPDHWRDMEKDHLIRKHLGVARVLRVREMPLTPTEDSIGVPPDPDPQLCALAVILHLQHDWTTRILKVEQFTEQWSQDRFWRLRDAIYQNRHQLRSTLTCTGCLETLADDYYLD